MKRVKDDRLWAPWRMAYISGADRSAPTPVEKADLLPGADPGCFMCRAVASREDHENLVILRGPSMIALLNRYPYNNGHLLIAPQRHLARLDEIDPDVHGEMIACLTQMTRVYERVMQAQGFNIGLNLGGAAGAGVPGHLHWHLVPRWVGDTNFMPVTAETGVISQSLESAWGMLTEALAEERGDG
jgi:ATP adenylyltransferase